MRIWLRLVILAMAAGVSSCAVPGSGAGAPQSRATDPWAPVAEFAPSREALLKLPSEELTWQAHGESGVSRAVPLEHILRSIGVEAGPGGKELSPAEKRPGLKYIVVVDCADGFQAVFSVAELLDQYGPTRACMIWERDGRPLDADDGPFRIVVPTDTRGARSARQVTRLRVFDARRLDSGRRQ